MPDVYARDLDLNLLRVFLVVAEHRSVTEAAARLYLTQPAVSAALRRLTDAVGAPLFVRQGRGLALTARGERLLGVRPHLEALIEGALTAAPFDPRTSDRVVRIGLSDGTDGWLLPSLLRSLAAQAPRMRVIVVGVQFRTVEHALATRAVDLAFTVADALPSSVLRRPVVAGGHVCLYDPAQVQLGDPVDADAYFAHEHVIVSYNGDLRGVVEDMLGRSRDVRCSVPSFAPVGAIVSGSSLLATVPATVAAYLQSKWPNLATAALPFDSGGTMELLWPVSTDDDPALRFVREAVAEAATATTRTSR